MSTSTPPPSSSLSTATADFSSGGCSSNSPYRPQHPACSACKHQRRKCSPGCLLAPYFPADQPGSFRNAHRLFGIKNILRFLEKAGPQNRDDAMKSMVYEADARAADPVGGALGVLLALDRELRLARAELAAVRQQLELCGHAVQHHSAPDAPGFLSPVQPWMPPTSPTITVAQHDYSSYMPYGVKMDEDARLTSMEHHEEGCTLAAAAPCEGEASSSSSSCKASNPPRGGDLSRTLGLRFTHG